MLAWEHLATHNNSTLLITTSPNHLPLPHIVTVMLCTLISSFLSSQCSVHGQHIMSCDVHFCNNGKKDSYDLCKQFSMSIANVFSSTSLRHCTSFFQDASLSLASHVQKISYIISRGFLCSFSILLTSVPSELFSRILPNTLYSDAALAKILMLPEGHGNFCSILKSGISLATGRRGWDYNNY